MQNNTHPFSNTFSIPKNQENQQPNQNHVSNSNISYVNKNIITGNQIPKRIPNLQTCTSINRVNQTVQGGNNILKINQIIPVKKNLVDSNVNISTGNYSYQMNTNAPKDSISLANANTRTRNDTWSIDEYFDVFNTNIQTKSFVKPVNNVVQNTQTLSSQIGRCSNTKLGNDIRQMSSTVKQGNPFMNNANFNTLKNQGNLDKPLIQPVVNNVPQNTNNHKVSPNVSMNTNAQAANSNTHMIMQPQGTTTVNHLNLNPHIFNTQINERYENQLTKSNIPYIAQHFPPTQYVQIAYIPHNSSEYLSYNNFVQTINPQAQAKENIKQDHLPMQINNSVQPICQTNQGNSNVVNANQGARFGYSINPKMQRPVYVQQIRPGLQNSWYLNMQNQMNDSNKENTFNSTHLQGCTCVSCFTMPNNNVESNLTLFIASSNANLPSSFNSSIHSAFTHPEIKYPAIITNAPIMGIIGINHEGLVGFIQELNHNTYAYLLLRTEYIMNSNPSIQKLNELAKKLNTTVDHISNWFNRENVVHQYKKSEQN